MPAKSKSQQRLMGMVHNCQKNGKCASDEIKKIADSIKASDATDFAETKHKTLPNKVKAESISFREYVLNETNDAAYQRWYWDVNRSLQATIGYDINELPEYDWQIDFDAGMSPEQAAEKFEKTKMISHDQDYSPFDKYTSEGYYTRPPIDRERYINREHEGLEGPYRQDNGKVLYYDTKEGKYYDPNTDFYVSNDELDDMAHSQEKRNELMQQQSERDFERRRNRK